MEEDIQIEDIRKALDMCDYNGYYGEITSITLNEDVRDTIFDNKFIREIEELKKNKGRVETIFGMKVNYMDKDIFNEMTKINPCNNCNENSDFLLYDREHDIYICNKCGKSIK